MMRFLNDANGIYRQIDKIIDKIIDNFIGNHPDFGINPVEQHNFSQPIGQQNLI